MEGIARCPNVEAGRPVGTGTFIVDINAGGARPCLRAGPTLQRQALADTLASVADEDSSEVAAWDGRSVY